MRLVTFISNFELICSELMWMFNCFIVCILFSVYHVGILLFVFRLIVLYCIVVTSALGE